MEKELFIVRREKYFFSQLVLNLWNSLPGDVGVASSQDALKRGIEQSDGGKNIHLGFVCAWAVDCAWEGISTKCYFSLQTPVHFYVICQHTSFLISLSSVLGDQIRSTASGKSLETLAPM